MQTSDTYTCVPCSSRPKEAKSTNNAKNETNPSLFHLLAVRYNLHTSCACTLSLTQQFGEGFIRGKPQTNFIISSTLNPGMVVGQLLPRATCAVIAVPPSGVYPLPCKNLSHASNRLPLILPICRTLILLNTMKSSLLLYCSSRYGAYSILYRQSYKKKRDTELLLLYSYCKVSELYHHDFSFPTQRSFVTRRSRYNKIAQKQPFHREHRIQGDACHIPRHTRRDRTIQDPSSKKKKKKVPAAAPDIICVSYNSNTNIYCIIYEAVSSRTLTASTIISTRRDRTAIPDPFPTKKKCKKSYLYACGNPLRDEKKISSSPFFFKHVCSL